MNRILACALVAFAVAGCQHQAPVLKVMCPTPPGELMIEPPRLPKIEDAKVPWSEAIAIWLNEKEIYRRQASRLARLQLWGAVQCKWSTPVPLKLEN